MPECSQQSGEAGDLSGDLGGGAGRLTFIELLLRAKLPSFTKMEIAIPIVQMKKLRLSWEG